VEDVKNRKRKFSQRVKQLREGMELSQEEVAKYLCEHDPTAVGPTKSNISRYESGNVLPKNWATLETLARLFRVSPNYLSGYTDDKHDTEQKCFTVPVLDKITQGRPLFIEEENIIDVECITKENKTDFCLIVADDSMTNACINRGDTIFIKHQSTVENSQIAVVFLDGKVLIRRYFRANGNIYLRPENMNYNETIVKTSEKNTLEILGRVLYNKSLVR